jgi:hypothetical protein
MSDCSDICVLSYDGDEPVGFTAVRVGKAHKPYHCCECHQKIDAGDDYERYVGQWDGSFATCRTCLLCVEIRDHFSCGNGWIFGRMWNTLREDLFDRLRFECLEGLSIPAKEKVLAEWRKWKGLEATAP